MRKKIWALGVLASLTLGCSPPEPRTVSMELGAVNTADKILVLEGKTDLPPGAKLDAELRTRDGKTLLRDRAVVRQGSFFFDFDMARLSEFSSYKVLVSFDPENAPLGVRHITGLWGEALEGPGVRQVGNRRVYWKEKSILLSTSARERDWEGRNFEEMEASERTRLTEELERYIEAKPQDKVAKLALAKAYLASESREYAVGSRAHSLLVEAARTPETDRNGRQARDLLARIEVAEKKRQAKIAKQKAASSGQRYRTNFGVDPGRSLGAFKLGTPYKVAARYFKLDRTADFTKGAGPQTVRLKDFHNLELTYDLMSRRLISVRTTSPKFKLPEGLGVGSLLQSLQKAYGKKAIYTPKFRAAGRSADGKKLFKGKVEAAGLEFEILREVEPMFGMPVDRVTAIRVFKP